MYKMQGKIPIVIHPFFWVTVFALGFFLTQNLIYTPIVGGIIIFSLVIHEYGHALCAYAFGKKPHIELVAMGGFTSYSALGLSYAKQFLIVLCGPLASLSLVFLGVYLANWVYSFFLLQLLVVFVRINLIWTIFNLLPIFPLDGGQLVRIFLESLFGAKGLRWSFILGIVLSLVLIGLGFYRYNMILVLLFFFFAFQNLQNYRQARYFSTKDQDLSLQNLLAQAEEALQKQQTDKAQKLLEEILNKTQEGNLYTTASQYLAFLHLEQGEKAKAYTLLKQAKKGLLPEGIVLLHELAFDQKDYALVTELSIASFEIAPSFAVAFRSAKSFAAQNDPSPAGGWLKKACSLQSISIEDLLQAKEFDSVRQEKSFKDFISQIKKP